MNNGLCCYQQNMQIWTGRGTVREEIATGHIFGTNLADGFFLDMNN
jgi:hypothetical protein